MTQYRPDHDAGDLPPTVGPQGGGGDAGAAPGDLVGTVLAGRYRILRKLGEGAMGNVYLGEHLKIGRQDAIKVLRDALSTDTEAIARFIRGTRNVSMIRHPNICTIYDYSDTDHGLQFVAMELVTGETLRDLVLREGALPLERAVHIAKQVADALQAAHEAGIVHRDLKPANVMITRGRRGEDEIKVVDFDIAKGPRDGEGGGEEVTRLGFVVGTPEYMSPEQLIGDRLDGRSDLYSLGLLLFRMLTGMLPFRAEGAQDLIIKRLTEEPLRLSDALPGAVFPEALEQALRRALSRKPEDRQADAEEFGEEIVRAIGGAAAGARPPAFAAAAQGAAAPPVSGRSLPETGVHRPAAPRPAQGRGRLVAAVAGVGGLAVVLGIGLATRGGSETLPPEPIALLQQPLSGDSNGAGAEPAPGGADPAGQAAGAPAPGEQLFARPADRVPETPVASDPAAPAAQPAAVYTPPAAPELALDAGAAQGLLVRLLERFDDSPAPTPARLRAIRDSAQLVIDRGPQSQSAFAYYVLANALVSLDDTDGAIRAVGRAADLEPRRTIYSDMLRRLRDARY
jgi:hypothetical protein